MKVLLKLLFLTGILMSTTESVKVAILYEALCGDSIRFIALQLYPFYAQLKPHLQLEFIPYGKATQNLVNNRWQFECQHGNEECKGNIYQSCALAQHNGQDKDAAFITCVMKERNPANVQRIEKCAHRFGINWSNISSCATSEKGKKLLAENGNRTDNLLPNVSFVPTIIYNDKYDPILQEQSLNNFCAVVCSKIKENKPNLCKNKQLPENRGFWGKCFVE